MPQYEVLVTGRVEYEVEGYITVDASNEDDAKEQAASAASRDEIDWTPIWPSGWVDVEGTEILSDSEDDTDPLDIFESV